MKQTHFPETLHWCPAAFWLVSIEIASYPSEPENLESMLSKLKTKIIDYKVYWRYKILTYHLLSHDELPEELGHGSLCCILEGPRNRIVWDELRNPCHLGVFEYQHWM